MDFFKYKRDKTIEDKLKEKVKEQKKHTLPQLKLNNKGSRNVKYSGKTSPGGLNNNLYLTMSPKVELKKRDRFDIKEQS